MDTNEVLSMIIDELVESDLTAHDFKIAVEIIEKYKEQK